jgi:hypothetical protein
LHLPHEIIFPFVKCPETEILSFELEMQLKKLSTFSTGKLFFKKFDLGLFKVPLGCYNRNPDTGITDGLGNNI